MSFSNKSILFPSSDLSLFSNEFELTEGVAVVSIIGLAEGDYVCVETYNGNECDGFWSPFAPTSNGQICICCPQNMMIISIPGRYRLELGNKFETHLTDPSHFEDVQAFFKLEKSTDALASFIETGDCGMGCGLTISDVKAIIEDCVDFPDDIYVSSIVPSASGWNAIRTDGTVMPIELIAGDGIEISGNTISATGAVTGGGTDTDVEAVTLVISDGANSKAVSVMVTENGNVVSTGAIDLPNDTSRADIATFSDPADRGLSLGEWNKPVGRAATYAEATGANSDTLGVSVAGLERVLTNRASENGAGARGVVNENGLMGHYTEVFNLDAWDPTVMANNGHTVVYDLNSGDLEINPSRYEGQIMRLRVEDVAGNNRYGEIEVSVAGGLTVDGNLRNVTDRGFKSFPYTRFIMRDQETITLVGTTNSNWEVLDFTPNFFFAPGWRENVDGKVSMFFQSTLLPFPGSDIVHTALMPVRVTNPRDLVVHVMDSNPTNSPDVGDSMPININDAAYNYVYFDEASTFNNLVIGSRDSVGLGAPAGTIAPGTVHIHVENALIDYNAL